MKDGVKTSHYRKYQTSTKTQPKKTKEKERYTKEREREREDIRLMLNNTQGGVMKEGPELYLSFKDN